MRLSERSVRPQAKRMARTATVLTAVRSKATAPPERAVPPTVPTVTGNPLEEEYVATERRGLVATRTLERFWTTAGCAVGGAYLEALYHGEPALDAPERTRSLARQARRDSAAPRGDQQEGSPPARGDSQRAAGSRRFGHPGEPTTAGAEGSLHEQERLLLKNCNV